MKPGPKGPSKWTAEVIEQQAASLLKYFEQPDSLFTETWCANVAYIPREYLSRWAAQNETFRAALEMVRTQQASRLLEGSVRDKLNARISALLLQSVHGYSTKSEVTVHEPENDHDAKVRATTTALMSSKPADPKKARKWLAEIQKNGDETAREAAKKAAELLEMEQMALNVGPAIVNE